MLEAGEREASIKQIKRIAEANNVGQKWVLTGDEKAKDWPVNDELIVYLESNPEVRKELWVKIGEREDLGAQMKEARMTRGLTQKQVAEILDVPRHTIVEIEVGGHKKDYALMDRVRKWVTTIAEEE